ncbi:MAG: hypothetical protein KBS61_06875 [Chryseobacterium sp.]|nr:hypothetical protein [Candidatus Chryseobacterium enterohippi]
MNLQKTGIKTIIALILSINTSAQFTIFNSLRTKDATGLKIGDNAYLTAASGADANGDGWMRLTDAAANKKGYMYVMQSFPTSLGFVTDFEYIVWRNVADNNYFGADRFSFFLFDGSITDANFKLGGWGGSLGYATFSNPAGTTGLSGGYLGIGFDEYGNFTTNTENRNGGTATQFPNSITFRGPTNATYSQSNVFLHRIDLGNRTGTLNDIRQRNEIDYNTTSAKRPLSSVFYRRVQVTITKVSTDYVVNVKWRKKNQTDFTNLTTFTMSSTTYPIPATLKIGFAAATGGGYNFHEIRNILLTTPGNLRIDGRSNFAYLCNDKKGSVSFQTEVTNSSQSDLTILDYNSQIQNSAGSLLNTNLFKITNVTTTGFTNSNIPTSGYTSNNVTGVVGLLANTSGFVTITGEYQKGIKTNDFLQASSSITTTQVTDDDLTNNYATTKVDLRKCNILSNPSIPANYK